VAWVVADRQARKSVLTLLLHKPTVRHLDCHRTGTAEHIVDVVRKLSSRLPIVPVHLPAPAAFLTCEEYKSNLQIILAYAELTLKIVIGHGIGRIE
jgi:hypothetical protein